MPSRKINPLERMVLLGVIGFLTFSLWLVGPLMLTDARAQAEKPTLRDLTVESRLTRLETELETITGLQKWMLYGVFGLWGEAGVRYARRKRREVLNND